MILKPKGTKDIYGFDAKYKLKLEEIIKEIANSYNYTYIDTPVFEHSELFHRGMGDTTDVVSKETYDFKDRGDRSLTLRPEGTASVARWFIENKLYGNLTEPIKSFYINKFYRYDRPQAGRYREFTQFGSEIIGTNDPIADAESISLAYTVLEFLGIDNLNIYINSLGDTESRENYKKALLEYLKPHKEELCNDCEERIEKNPLRVLDCKIDGHKEIIKDAPKTIDYLNEDSLKHYNKVKQYLDLMDINYTEDFNLVRGLDYYTHTVFEINHGDDLSIVGGGRYNGLIELLDGPKTPAVGFAMGIDRVINLLNEKEVNLNIKDNIDVFIIHVSETEKETAVYLAQDLRLNGLVVETDFFDKGIKGGFKSADRLNAEYVILLNDNDLKENLVTIKDNKTKDEEKVKMFDVAEYLNMRL